MSAEAPAGPVLLPASVLDSVLGALLIGTWLNAMAFAIEILQVARYIQLFPKDAPWIRCLVAFMFLLDVAGTCNSCAMSYLYSVRNFGNVEYLMVQNITLPLWTSLTMVSILCMHAFLIRRYWILSRNYIVSGILVTMALAAAGGACGSVWGIVHLNMSKLEDRPKIRTTGTVWLALSAAADITVAFALIHELRKVRTVSRQTQSLIRRLIRRAVTTGCATATLAVGTLIAFIIKPESNYMAIFCAPIGRVCTLTILYSLNERKMNGKFGDTITSGVVSTIGFAFTTAQQQQQTDAGVGGRTSLAVHKRSVLPHIDGGLDDSVDDSKTFEMESKPASQHVV